MTDLREMGRFVPPPKIIDCVEIIELHKKIESKICGLTTFLENPHAINLWIYREEVLKIIEEEFGNLTGD